MFKTNNDKILEICQILRNLPTSKIMERLKTIGNLRSNISQWPSATTLRHEPQVRTGGGWMIEEWGGIPDVPDDFFKEALIKTCVQIIFGTGKSWRCWCCFLGVDWVDCRIIYSNFGCENPAARRVNHILSSNSSNSSCSSWWSCWHCKWWVNFLGLSWLSWNPAS